ncbi:MAG: hypothetical protein CMJ58_22840 [Planctomycetaceae bacterium]|nr:hypothetical protein [Planctomycetaceae bacterium]
MIQRAGAPLRKSRQADDGWRHRTGADDSAIAARRGILAAAVDKSNFAPPNCYNSPSAADFAAAPACRRGW